MKDALNGRTALVTGGSGAIGRLVPEDVVGLVRYLAQHAGSTSA
jgi:FlaA1/EpsC-like NDP-sugar epimerase